MGARRGLRPRVSVDSLLFGGVGGSDENAKTPYRASSDAFKIANRVALGDRHWAREDSEFRLKLIRNPAFLQTVTDIVVKFANPLYQDFLDCCGRRDRLRGATVLLSFHPPANFLDCSANLNHQSPNINS